jgi:phosphohistidine phosphatase SixA
MKKIKKIISIKNLIYVAIIFIVVLNSIIGLYEKKNKICKVLNKLIFIEIICTLNYGGAILPDKEKEKNYFWANEIKKGGYFLLFRHAHREKWSESVHAFDAYSIFENIDQESSNFKDGVCLSLPRGTEQAKMIGNIFRTAKVKIDKVFSSPSCRSAQTAKFAFGKIDKTWNCLLHPTAINPKLVPKCANNLKRKIISHKILKDHNIILSSHGNTIDKYGRLLWDQNEATNLTLDEGGFAVIEAVNNEIIIKHVFNNFRNFSLNVNNLPLN